MQPDLSDPYFQAGLISSGYAQLAEQLKCLTKRMKEDLEWTETEARSVLYLVGVPKDLADASLVITYHREELLAECSGR
jgi:hypothetical protein